MYIHFQRTTIERNEKAFHFPTTFWAFFSRQIRVQFIFPCSPIRYPPTKWDFFFSKYPRMWFIFYIKFLIKTGSITKLYQIHKHFQLLKLIYWIYFYSKVKTKFLHSLIEFEWRKVTLCNNDNKVSLMNYN